MQKWSKKEYINIIILIIGVLISAINFNMFLLPNNFVIGGMSGIGIILYKFINLNPYFFVLFMSSLFAIFSYAFFNRKGNKTILINAYFFPVALILTSFLTDKINFHFDNIVLSVIVSGVLAGFSSGLILKTGYNSGGFEEFVIYFHEFKKLPLGLSFTLLNSIIIIISAFVFGAPTFTYAILVFALKVFIINKITIGVSDSKLFMIHSDSVDKIKSLILDEMESGMTFIETHGPSKKKREMILCVLRTSDYFLFKERILEIDPNAFITINDCYEVKGGVKKPNLPFI